jgi:hypothetical protein
MLYLKLACNLRMSITFSNLPSFEYLVENYQSKFCLSRMHGHKLDFYLTTIFHQFKFNLCKNISDEYLYLGKNYLSSVFYKSKHLTSLNQLEVVNIPPIHILCRQIISFINTIFNKLNNYFHQSSFHCKLTI